MRNAAGSLARYQGRERGKRFRDRGTPFPAAMEFDFRAPRTRPQAALVARTLHYQSPVRNRNHPELSEKREMNARASTPAVTGEAQKAPTLGSVWGNDEGQDLAEYAILIGLIALVVVGAVTLLGGAIMTSLYQVIIDGLPFN